MTPSACLTPMLLGTTPQWRERTDNHLYLTVIFLLFLKSFEGQHHLEIKLISVTSFTEYYLSAHGQTCITFSIVSETQPEQSSACVYLYFSSQSCSLWLVQEPWRTKDSNLKTVSLLFCEEWVSVCVWCSRKSICLDPGLSLLCFLLAELSWGSVGASLKWS